MQQAWVAANSAVSSTTAAAVVLNRVLFKDSSNGFSKVIDITVI